MTTTTRQLADYLQKYMQAFPQHADLPIVVGRKTTDGNVAGSDAEAVLISPDGHVVVMEKSPL